MSNNGREGATSAMPRQGLLLKEQWGARIIYGRASDGLRKTWEIRGNKTHKTGQRIGILVGKELLGTVTLVGCFPLDEATYEANKEKHQHGQWADVVSTYKKPHIWVLEGAVAYAHPVDVSAFRKQGQVKWVNLFVGNTA